MKLIFQTFVEWLRGILTSLCIIGISLSANAYEELSPSASKKLKRMLEEQVDSLETASAAELKGILSSEIHGDLKLADLLKNLPYELDRGSVEWLFEETVLVVMKGNQGSFKNRQIPLELSVACMRKMEAILQLQKRKDKSWLDWLLKRADETEPTLSDAVIYFRTLGSFDEGNITQSDMNLRIQDSLLVAKNPICRMLAMDLLRAWGRPEDIASVIERAMNDDLLCIRSGALDLLKKHNPARSREILESFINRKLDPNLPEKYKKSEDFLVEAAKRALRALEQQK